MACLRHKAGGKMALWWLAMKEKIWQGMPLPPSSTWNTHYKYPLISMIHDSHRLYTQSNRIWKIYFEKTLGHVSEGVGAGIFSFRTLPKLPEETTGSHSLLLKETSESHPSLGHHLSGPDARLSPTSPNSSARVTCEGIRSGAIIAARVVGEPRVHLRWQVTALLEEFTSTEMTSEKSS